MRRLLVALPLLLAACGSNEHPGTSPGPSSIPPVAEQRGTEFYYRLSGDDGATVAEFDAPVEKVWGLILAAYQSAGVEVGTLDTRTHTIGNRAITTTRRLGQTPIAEYVRCAQGGSGIMNATTYRVQLSVLSTLKPGANGGTRMETTLAATGIPAEGASRNAVPCPSTGRLEQKLADAVKGSLAG